MNFCTEFSNAEVFPVSIVNKMNLFFLYHAVHWLTRNILSKTYCYLVLATLLETILPIFVDSQSSHRVRSPSLSLFNIAT